MRLSAKGRYALTATVMLAQHYASGDCTTVLSISERFNISKIYLEQVFALLKRGGVVLSIKGSQGGYQLARPPKDITLYDILSAVELTLFEANDATVADTAPEIEAALNTIVFESLDSALKSVLTKTSLEKMTLEAESNKTDSGMYYI